MENRDVLIQFDKASFVYDEGSPPALSDIDISLYKGEFTVILGHNGSGKSTLAKLTNALLLPTQGGVTVRSMPTGDEANEIAIRKIVGMVFQNPDNQIVSTVVEDDVAFGPENLGVPSGEIRQRVDEALKAVGMYEYRAHEAHRLSGGQKQRVAIAGVLAMRTECVVFDEPTAMLDPKGREEVYAAIRRLNDELGVTVILITHFMKEAVYADRVIVMDSGHIRLDGAPREVFSNRALLEQIGLELPKPLELSLMLGQSGENMDAALTDDEFIEAFTALLERRHGDS